MPRVIVVYDISNDRKRLELASALKSYGLVRVQRSMFIGRVSSQTLKDIVRKADKIIDKEHDVVHVIPITIYAYQHMKVIGTPLASLEDRGVEVVYNSKTRG